MESGFLNTNRQEQILKVLEQKGEVQLQKLAEMFPDVSTMTLRRDLISLEKSGYLVRTYGGAVSTKRILEQPGEEDEYSRRALENVEAKLKIARKAVSLVEVGRSMYFDAGSTIMCLAGELPNESYSIVTSGANIALELIKKPSVSVVTVGGLVNRNTLSMSGPNAVSFIDTINIDLAFMSASGFSLDSGFTVANLYECELKRKVVERARKVIILMDSGKINKNLAFTYCTLEDVDAWVCEKELPEEIMEQARMYNVEVI
jgi:DeoR/GlpR family transcriptional regulator of sugar metabolism